MLGCSESIHAASVSFILDNDDDDTDDDRFLLQRLCSVRSKKGVVLAAPRVCS